MPQLVLFQTGNMHFAINPLHVGAVDPKGSGATAGTENCQSHTITHEGRSYRLVDLSAALGPDVAQPHTADAKVIVVKEASLALWADRIEGTLSVEAEDIEALPRVFTNFASACFSRVLRLRDRLALVVDRAALAKVEQIVDSSAPAKVRQTKSSAEPILAEQPSALSPPTEPSGDHVLEHVVIDKLERFIGRRVKQTLARAIAETLDQRRAQT